MRPGQSIDSETADFTKRMKHYIDLLSEKVGYDERDATGFTDIFVNADTDSGLCFEIGLITDNESPLAIAARVDRRNRIVWMSVNDSRNAQAMVSRIIGRDSHCLTIDTNSFNIVFKNGVLTHATREIMLDRERIQSDFCKALITATKDPYFMTIMRNYASSFELFLDRLITY